MTSKAVEFFLTGAVFAIPVAVFLTLVFLLLRKRRASGQKSLPVEPMSIASPIADVSAKPEVPVKPVIPAQQEVVIAPVIASPPAVQPEVPIAPVVTAAQADVPEKTEVVAKLEVPAAATHVPVPAPVAADVIESVMGRIKSLMAGGDRSGLAPLYLELASTHAQAGNEPARMTALRSAAGYGAQHGPKVAHAEARLALAEVAYAAGDLTSACEQWQLARTAFQEGGDAERYDAIDKRMRANGCPTDWVLTDF